MLTLRPHVNRKPTMPPHGHHHGSRPLPGFYPFYAGGEALTPSQDVYIVNAPNAPTAAQVTAFIQSLPAAQRAAAYQKFFGVKPGALSGLDSIFGQLTTIKIVGLGAAVIFGALMLTRRRPNPARRRRARRRR